jgi:hypothetical protein
LKNSLGENLVTRKPSSHPATTLIKLVAVDDRLDVLSCSGKIDVLAQFCFANVGNAERLR